ncbi:MAG: hypothetical protein OIF48_02150 [Silicimonas sp.]|nr:hypothetical protein [Silicimonas sp.]
MSLVLLVGVGLVGATAFLAIDSLATDDRRAAVQDAIADRATAYDAGESRRRGLMGRLASGYQTLAGGIFKSSGLDLPAALPPAPEGWVQRDYVDADGMAITGAAYKKSGISISTTNSILGRFDKARGAGKMTARATYAAGAQMIAI